MKSHYRKVEDPRGPQCFIVRWGVFYLTLSILERPPTFSIGKLVWGLKGLIKKKGIAESHKITLSMKNLTTQTLRQLDSWSCSSCNWNIINLPRTPECIYKVEQMLGQLPLQWPWRDRGDSFERKVTQANKLIWMSVISMCFVLS